ncbi:noggin-2-like [Mya arenaria]|uniref:noggin-2-like n=1 Tax=Mya arenaria TaxID=6604 RepID=UPI0022E631E9|nr:noggin-2-like [Mya arenaria]
MDGTRKCRLHNGFPSQTDISVSSYRTNDPSGKHLNPKKLFRRLGNSFDPEWMSVTDPSENKLFQNSSVHEHHPNDVYAYSMTRARVSDILRDRYNLGVEIESLDVIVTFLHDFSTCHVKYKWEDLGQLFWPRFVKKGSCDSSGPCSWPQGTRYQQCHDKTLQFLRWICKKGRRKIAVQTRMLI